MKALLKPKKNNKIIYQKQLNEIGTGRTISHTMEELTEYNEKEIIFTVQLKINLENKKGRKILKRMIETQTSPVTTIMQDKNAGDRKFIREGKQAEEYTLPKEIIELIKQDFEIKKFETYND